MSKIQPKESKEMTEVKEQVEVHTKIFLGMAAGIVGIAILMVEIAFCFILGQEAVVWLWNALGN